MTAARRPRKGCWKFTSGLRPGEPPTVDSARSLLRSMFFDPKRYDLMRVGRYKFNKKLSIAERIAGFAPGAGRDSSRDGRTACQHAI